MGVSALAWGAGLNNFGTTAVVATPAGGDVERKGGEMLLNACGERGFCPKILQPWVSAPPTSGCCILQLILALLEHQGLDFYPGEGRLSPKLMRVLQIYQQGRTRAV